MVGQITVADWRVFVLIVSSQHRQATEREVMTMGLALLLFETRFQIAVIYNKH